MANGYRVDRWSQPFPPNPAMFRYWLGNEGYQVYQWCDRPGTVYGIHKHELDQTHWIVAGTLELTILELGSYVLQAGDRDFMPAGTMHSARVIGDEPVLYLVGEKRQPPKPARTRKPRKTTAKPAKAKKAVRAKKEK